MGASKIKTKSPVIQVHFSDTLTKHRIVQGLFDADIQADETVQIEQTTLLLYDTSQEAVAFNTLVVDQNRGLIATQKTTRQLIARLQDTSLGTIREARIYRNMLHIANGVVPLVYGRSLFIPMASPFRGNCDWINGRHIHTIRDLDKATELLWDKGIKAQVFDYHDFETKIHDAVLICQYSIQILKEMYESGYLHEADNEILGRYNNCDCPNHQRLAQAEPLVPAYQAAQLEVFLSCAFPKSEYDPVDLAACTSAFHANLRKKSRC